MLLLSLTGETEEEYNDYQDLIDVRKTTYYKRERSGSLPASRVSDMSDSLLTESAEIEHDHEHAEKLIHHHQHHHNHPLHHLQVSERGIYVTDEKLILATKQGGALAPLPPLSSYNIIVIVFS